MLDKLPFAPQRGKQKLGPSLQVRPACVEDHDDLMPVFEAQSDLLRATYGDFFLADMIELQDDQNKVGIDHLSFR